MMKNTLKITLLLTMLASTTLVAAQSKVGFVNTERILKESPLAQEAQKNLMSEFAARDTKLAETANELKRKSERLERDGSTISATERQKLQQEITGLDATFQRERRNLEEEIQARRSQMLSNILERANREIVRIAEAEKIDIVLQEAVWWSPKIDLTPKVIEALKR